MRTTFHRKCVRPIHPVHGNGQMTIVNDNPTKLATTGRLGHQKCRMAMFRGCRLPNNLLQFNVPGFGLKGGVVSHHVQLVRRRKVIFGIGAVINGRMSTGRVTSAFSTIYVTVNSRIPHSLPVRKHGLGNIRFTLRLLSRRGHVLRNVIVPPGSVVGYGNGGVLVVNNNSAKDSYIKATGHRGTTGIARVRVVPRPPIKRGPAAP